MVEKLESANYGLSDEEITPLPSYDMYGYGFSPVQYWRGPVWLNINWFLMARAGGLWVRRAREEASADHRGPLQGGRFQRVF